jgi:serine/threonine-protein kinase
MDTNKPNKEEGLDAADTHGVSTGGASLDFGNVKQVLSAKKDKGGTHYTQIEPLGKGSFGEVHCAHDTLLGREVAIKSLKKNFREDEEVVDRFLKEARGTAQLEHPNIMPVHEMGVSEEFGIYFTMKKVQGEDLKEILDKLDGNPAFYESSYPLNFLLEVFLSVCNGVAFAHSKGVIHRDLKPANIMIGEFGEVLVLDWGLVKNIGEEDEGSGSSIHLRMDEFDIGSQTLEGAVSGTPNYMAPEQAEGRIGDIDIHSDIYSLGAILYHILARCPPFEKTQLRRLLGNVKAGIYDPPRKRRPELNIPKELEAICLKAMSRHPLNRYLSVEKLAQDIRNYIGNFEVTAYKATRLERFWRTCKRNPVKSSVVAAVCSALVLAFGAQRAALYGGYSNNVHKADVLREEARAVVAQAKMDYDELAAISLATPEKEKSDEELSKEANLEKLLSQIKTKYSVALSLYQGVPKPYRRKRSVVDGYIQIVTNRIDFALYRKAYAEAEQLRDAVELDLQQLGLIDARAYSYFAAIQHQIDGAGSLSISGSNGVSRVEVFPLFDVGPRRKMGDLLDRGELPLEISSLAKGGYMLTVILEDGSILPYPIFIGHGENKEVVLDIPEKIPSDMAYIPSGAFIFGGEASRFYRKQRIAIPSFFIKKYEVTVAEYLEFWNGLSDPKLKADYMSRIQFDSRTRHYMDAWDATGNILDERLGLDFPVVGITHHAAEAFCVWKSRQTGKTIRLPTAAEWEKAARGVDGRRYVWGNGLDRDLVLTKYNTRAKKKYPYWAPPGSFRATDVSVYNVFDMAGNVREMTASLFPNSKSGGAKFYQIKGGSGSTPDVFLPCCNASDTPVAPSDIGFRYIQEIPSK